MSKKLAFLFHFLRFPVLSSSLMEPYFSHSMFLWTKDLKKVEKINLGRYGVSGMLAMRGVKVDWDFINACLRFWDPELHVF